MVTKINVEYLWAQFENNDIGNITYIQLYKVHVMRFEHQFFKLKSASVLREQFPVRYAAGYTTHRYLGDKTESVVIDFPGRTFIHTCTLCCT